MTNRHGSKQHGMTQVNKTQPKSKLRARRNKAKAVVRKAERRAVLKKG